MTGYAGAWWHRCDRCGRKHNTIEDAARCCSHELRTDGGEPLVDDVELAAQVAIGHRGSELLPMTVAAVEWVPRGEKPLVKLELYDDTLELDAFLDVEGAEQLRDRLDEVLAVIDESG